MITRASYWTGAIDVLLYFAKNFFQSLRCCVTVYKTWIFTASWKSYCGMVIVYFVFHVGIFFTVCSLIFLYIFIWSGSKETICRFICFIPPVHFPKTYMKLEACDFHHYHHVPEGLGVFPVP